LAQNRKKHLTIVHKANVLKIADNMFIDICHTIGKEFPSVRIDDFIVDAMMAHVVRAPDQFDVIVTTNMFGDILSDLTSELSGSLGLAGTLNAGVDFAMGQAAHGSAPDIAGKNIANPFSQIISAAMLLNWYGQKNASPSFIAASNAMELTTLDLMKSGQVTADVGGNLKTDEIAKAFIKQLQTHA
jgi:3-isopropylmalate dehydrogenase